MGKENRRTSAWKKPSSTPTLWEAFREKCSNSQVQEAAELWQASRKMNLEKEEVPFQHWTKRGGKQWKSTR